ncbi:hypothetical protein O1157_18665 [Streptomyces albogriseolus]
MPVGFGRSGGGAGSSASGVVSKSVVACGSKSPVDNCSGDSAGGRGPAPASSAAIAPRFSAKRLSRRVTADATASGGTSVIRPSAVAVPVTTSAVPASTARGRSRSASRTDPLPRASAASPSTA